MSDLREVLRQTAALNDLVPIDVPEWGTKVYIRKLTVRDQQGLGTGDDPTISGLKMLIASIVDENGKQYLTAEDLDLLLDQPVGIVVPLLLEAGRLNGLTGTEVEEAVSSLGKTPGRGSDIE